MLIYLRGVRYLRLDTYQHLRARHVRCRKRCKESSCPEPGWKLVAENESGGGAALTLPFVTWLGHERDTAVADEQRSDESFDKARTSDTSSGVAATAAPWAAG